MNSMRIKIVNPKAVKLLKDLAEMDLIAIQTPSSSGFKNTLKKLRSNGNSSFFWRNNKRSWNGKNQTLCEGEVELLLIPTSGSVFWLPKNSGIRWIAFHKKVCTALYLLRAIRTLQIHSYHYPLFSNIPEYALHWSFFFEGRSMECWYRKSVF